MEEEQEGINDNKPYSAESSNSIENCDQQVLQYKSDLGNNEFQIDDSDTKDKKTHRIVLGAAIFESQDLLRRTCFIVDIA